MNAVEQALERLHPFYVALDDQLRVLSYGRVLRHLCGDQLQGKPFLEAFAVSEPAVRTAEELFRVPDAPIFATLAGQSLQLRGQALEVEGRRYFVGSPWFSVESSKEARLSPELAAPHESWGDQLFALQLVEQQKVDLKNLLADLRLRRAESGVYRDFFSLAPDLMCTLDPNLRFVQLGSRWPAAVGWALEELRDCPLTDFLHPEDRESVRQEADKVRARGAPTVDFEARFRTKAGDWLTLSWVVLFRGGVFWCSARDISARKRMETALSDSWLRLQTVLDSAVDAIVTIDASGKIEQVNRAVERVFGYTPVELVGRNVRVLMPSPDRENHDGYMERYRRTGVRRVIGVGRDVMAIRKDGTVFPAELAVSEFVLNGVRRFTGILRDVTDRRRAEEKLSRARQLELDIGARIQQTLLNGQVPDGLRGLDVAAFASPSQHVDGDFFEVLAHSDMVVDVVLGDGMGKGVPAALVSAATKSQLLRAFTHLQVGPSAQLLAPEDIVNLLHRGITAQLIALDSFLTLSLCRFDVTRQVLTVVDCGHTPVLVVHRDGQVSHLKGDNVPLGVRASERYQQREVPLEEGDVVVLYSDGATEARNARGELFGLDRLTEAARAVRTRPAAEIVRALQATVAGFGESATLADDVTCVVVRVPPGARRRELRLTSSLDHLATVRGFVRSVCAQKLTPVVSEEHLQLLELAVNEAFSNVVIHGYERQDGQPIDLAVELEADAVVLELRHRGRPFDPGSVRPPSFDGTRDGGFGLHLIRQSVDELTFETGPNGATVVRMRRALTRP